jgi:hypothetical protein
MMMSLSGKECRDDLGVITLCADGAKRKIDSRLQNYQRLVDNPLCMMPLKVGPTFRRLSQSLST